MWKINLCERSAVFAKDKPFRRGIFEVVTGNLPQHHTELPLSVVEYTKCTSTSKFDLFCKIKLLIVTVHGGRKRSGGVMQLLQRSKRKTTLKECLFFLAKKRPSLKAFGYAALFETAELTWSFFPFFLSVSFPVLLITQELGGAVKSATIRCVIKIIQVLLGLPWEGGMGGGVRVKWLYSTIHLS